jgi:hypothetical protein
VNQTSYPDYDDDERVDFSLCGFNCLYEYIVFIQFFLVVGMVGILLWK